MIKVGELQWDEMTDEQKIGFCDSELISPVDEERQEILWEWFINRSFLDGNHYIQYNATRNTIEVPKETSGRVRLVINKAKGQVDSVVNYAVSQQPRWEVMPGDSDDDTVRRARRMGKFLDYAYRVLFLRDKIRQAVDFAMWTSIGIFEHGFDEMKGKDGEIYVVAHDPFDIVIPLNAVLDGPEIVSARFIAKITPRDVDAIHADERYDDEKRKGVEADGAIAFAELKQSLRERRGEKRDNDTKNTALVREVLIWDAEGNSKGGNMQLVTYAGDNLLLDKPLKRKKYPYVIFQPEGGYQLYSTPRVKHMIPINKAIDRLESLILEWNIKMNRARIVAEKGHGVNLAGTGRDDAREVEVIEYNPGRKFEQWQISPLPLTISRQISGFNDYLDVISGASQATPSSLPSNVRSNDMLESIRAAEANNLANIRERLETTLSVLGHRLLEEADEHYSTSRIIKITDPEDDMKQFEGVIGRTAGGKKVEQLEKDGKAFVIEPSEVFVTIGSWLGYSREAQRETLLKMAEVKLIPAEEVLRQFEFPNIEQLSQRAREERLEESMMQAHIAGRNQGQQPGQLPQQPQAAPGGATSPQAQQMVDLADEENARMINGEQLPPTPGAIPQHTEAHMAALEFPEVQGNPTIQQVLNQHIQGELQQQGLL